MSNEELLDLAKKAMSMSYAPYSHYNVGAALLCKNGRIYLGCNIENAAYSPTVCAERCAFFKAVSDGEREFSAIAVVGGMNGSIAASYPPCGVCRQVMSEFCDTDSFKIILPGVGNTVKEYTLRDLLPEGFGPGNIK